MSRSLVSRSLVVGASARGALHRSPGSAAARRGRSRDSRRRRGRCGASGVGTAPAGTTAAVAAGDELSVTTRLADRRQVAAGTRAQSLGFQDGRFYANGWHITGEMGGVWTPPMKMVDGVWFGLDGQWVGPATRFTSGWGYSRRKDLPTTAGLNVTRTDFVPDGTRATLFGLTITNPGAGRATTLPRRRALRAHGRPTRGAARGTPNASDQPARRGLLRRRGSSIRDQGPPPGAAAPTTTPHSSRPPRRRRPESATSSGPRPGTRVHLPEPGASAPTLPSRRRVSARAPRPAHLRRRLARGGSKTIWFAVAGSDEGVDAARGELAKALRDPDASAGEKKQSRQAMRG